MLRYVERNPLRAELVDRAQDWLWSSRSSHKAAHPAGLLSPGPVAIRRGWTAHVNGIETEAELSHLRNSVHRGTPFGSDRWTRVAPKALRLESSLRPRGRPRTK